MTHQMTLCDGPFRMVEAGTKTVELRLYDEKRRLVRVGDEILFRHAQTDETCRCFVREVRVFPDFAELYRHYTKTEMGYTENETADPDDMLLYYQKDDIARLGVVAIRIAKL